MNRKHALRAALGATLFASPAVAQFGNEWVSFQNDTFNRLSVATDLGAADTEEKDYVWADLDQDGWVDLVVVRKQPFTTTGRRVNVLLMNEGGVLTDRTALYATSSDVAGDLGFQTETNDRDVALIDADKDGWLDIATAPALGFGLAKHISHPRVYMNLADGGGSWGGFQYQDARIPQLLTSAGVPEAPAFCGVWAGDVDSDGYDDLHFTDYDTGGGSGSKDMNDRLLINDGAGFFSDESSLRMTSSMLDSSFGTSSRIVELNGLPGLDMLKNESGSGEAMYNDAGNVGTYNIWDPYQGGSPYHVSHGDLNNDGRIDAIWSDDGADRYRYNLGTDPLGRVIWGSNKTFSFVTGGDDGFGSDSLAVDLDGDTFQDVIVCDVDVDVSGCGRRVHIYHNPGGAVGSEITLIEEAGGSSSADWRGVVGLTANDLRGGHDVAVFDLDNDGDNDMILGRCDGTFVWMNDTTLPVCQKDLGFGGPGITGLSVCGGELSTGNSATLKIESGPASASGAIAIGAASNPTFIDFLDATIVPWVPSQFLQFHTDASGNYTLTIQGGNGPSTWFIQAVIVDPLQGTGFSVTNAIEVELLP
ncbi:MAG: hypothetical protein AAF682_12725 [Planctomycetota bacterium]